MATLISTTNVKLSELNTAPGGSTGGNMRFANMADPGWSEGPVGSNAYAYYTWGMWGTPGGEDIIYGLTAANGPYKLSHFRGKQYWFDGTTFDIKYRYTNNLNVPGPPTPPTANDVSIEVVVTDYAQNYSIFGGPNTPPNFFFSINAPANSGQASTQIPGFSTDQYPLVKNVFWKIRVNTDALNFMGGSVDVLINSANVYSGGLAPGQNDIDFLTAGAGPGYTDGSGILLEFNIY